jgi:hypothetical protein
MTHLNLGVLPAPLLGDFLSDTLLVDASVDGGPGDLARVLALKEEGLLLRGDETERGRLERGKGKRKTVENSNESRRVASKKGWNGGLESIVRAGGRDVKEWIEWDRAWTRVSHQFPRESVGRGI